MWGIQGRKFFLPPAVNVSDGALPEAVAECLLTVHHEVGVCNGTLSDDIDVLLVSFHCLKETDAAGSVFVLVCT